MTPQNQPVIKKTVITFSILVGLLSVLIASTSWSYLGSRISLRQSSIDSLSSSLVTTDSLRKAAVTYADSLGRMVAACEQDLLAYKNNKMPQEIEMLAAYIGDTKSSSSKLLSRYADSDGDLDPDSLSRTSKKLLDQFRNTLVDIADAMEKLEKTSSEGGAGGAGAKGAGDKQAHEAKPAASSEDHARLEAEKKACEDAIARSKATLDIIREQVKSGLKNLAKGYGIPPTKPIEQATITSLEKAVKDKNWNSKEKSEQVWKEYLNLLRIVNR
ncbi:MAG: hypothetical protein IPI07_18660 [Flavobacteriales bacterium]|nr:hypothetical protein [Flavobacteriales bacterium]